MKRLLIFIIATLLVCGESIAGSYGGGSTGGYEKARKPNVLLITMDDIGWDALDYSPAQHSLLPLAGLSTPNIDALRADGVTFVLGQAERWCVATRAELLTGFDVLVTYGDRPENQWLTSSNISGQTDGNTPGIPNLIQMYNKPMLPKYLSDAGYTTYGSGKNGIGTTGELGQTPNPLTAEPNAIMGFDHAMMWPFSQGNTQLWCQIAVFETVNGGPQAQVGWQGVMSPYLGDCATTFTYADGAYTQRAMDYLDTHYSSFPENPEDAPPWFLWLSFLGPHIPHTPFPGNNTFNADPMTGINANNQTGSCINLDAQGNTVIDANTNVECFVKHINEVDVQIGNMVNHLTPAQRADTLIILHGDNGSENWGSKPWLDAAINLMDTFNSSPTCLNSNNGATCLGSELTEEQQLAFSTIEGSAPHERGIGKNSVDHTGTGVPLIIAGGVLADVSRNTFSNAAVTMTDLNQTILDVAGVHRIAGDLPAGSDNVLARLQDTRAPCSSVMNVPSQCDSASRFGVTFVHSNGSTNLAAGRAIVDNAGYKYYRQQDSLYNLVSDPEQTTPLCTIGNCEATATGPDLVALQALLTELARYPDTWPNGT